MTETATFDEVGGEFIDYYKTVRGYVRQEVTRANLDLWLPTDQKLDVLDFGGGDGRDALWLAASGHRVTIIDSSTEMLARVEQKIAATKSATTKYISLIHGSVERVPEDSFDLVLSHGVLQYELQNPVGQMNTLGRSLRSHGTLSLLTAGFHAKLARVSGDKAAQQALIVNGDFINRLGAPARAYTFQALREFVLRSGLNSVAQYGVRIVNDDDRRQISTIETAELDQIVKDELAASHSPARSEYGQMLHVIATK